MHASLLFVALLSSFPFSTLSAPSGHHVVHEKRDVSSQWVKRSRLPPKAVMPVRIALAQSNLERGEEFLLELSNPVSSRYGKHWTPDDISNMFAPSEATFNATTEWLVDSGISKDRIVYTPNRGAMAFNATVEEAEALLGTEYALYRHASTQDSALGCDQYHVPSHMTKHIDFITPGIALSKRSTRRKESKRLAKRDSYQNLPNSWGQNYTLARCADGALSQCLNALYDIPPPTSSHPNNSIGIFEYNATYVQDDMDLFFQRLAPQIPVGTTAINNLINGQPMLQTYNDSNASSVRELESDLDFQLAWPLLYPQNITLFGTLPTEAQGIDDYIYSIIHGVKIGSLVETDGLDDLASSIDASYCVGSDDSPCGIFEAPKVLSISYGNDEIDIPPAKATRLCNEFLKLGLQGTTVVVSSGDGGVASYDFSCLGPKNNTFDPQFPASCPWVTTTGGTMLNPSGSIYDPEVAAYDQYTDSDKYYASSGGFSNYFPAPTYQTDAVARYFYQTPPPYPSYNYTGPQSLGANGGRFNRLGRAFPDIAALSVNLTSVVNSGVLNIEGTSASAPIVASIIARINNERLTAGKSPVGFINPVLYANPEVLTDIVLGSTVGCGTNGFPAVSGWDPVTGLGTPNYERMLSLFMSLP